jgi:recombination protein RecA
MGVCFSKILKLEKGFMYYLPSGSTLLNLSCTDSVTGAFSPGSIVTIPGSSVAGKTLLTLSCLSAISKNADFDEYRLLFDDTEQALSFDISRIFGEKLYNRIETPVYGFSQTVEGLQMNVSELLDDGKPFVYVVDSLDSLSSEEELQRDIEARVSKDKGKTDYYKSLSATYATERSKGISRFFRIVNNGLSDTGSLLLVIQQERDKIGGFGYGSNKTTSGGRSVLFYSFHQVWMSKIKTLTKTVRGKKYIIGSKTKVEVKKNKCTGKVREITLDNYYFLGIDDVVSCLDWLVETGFVNKKSGGVFVVEGLVSGTKNEIRSKMFGDDVLYKNFMLYVGDCWAEIESELTKGFDNGGD